jgi:hypothetical protein
LLKGHKRKEDKRRKKTELVKGSPARNRWLLEDLPNKNKREKVEDFHVGTKNINTIMVV